MVGAHICSAWLLAGSPEPTAPDIALSWDAPPQCPTKDDVLARVRARVADRPAVRVEVEAVVERAAGEPEAWTLRLWLKGDEAVAERHLDAQSCEALADVAATIVAVAATEPATAPATAIEIPAPTEVARAPTVLAPERSMASSETVATRSAPITARARRVASPRARLGVLGGVEYGALPGTGGTLVADVGLQWPRIRIAAFGMYGFGRRVSVRDVAARYRLAAGGVSACAVAPLRAFELGGCASVELGALVAEGTRGRDLKTRQSLWTAGSLGAFAGWRFARRWSLVVRVDAVAPFLRRKFLVGHDVVGRVGPIGVRALGGLAVVLP